ncbi:MAG: pseudouridine synthase [Opitutales bacterium]|nr:pseudouridine synthase [Opitutales bacterium]
MAKNGDFIGFPENRLREKPVRLPVLKNEPDWFAVNKFAGLLPQAHPWYQGKPNLTQAIRDQVNEGKGELQRLGITHCYYICGPECESSGPALFAKTKIGADLLKNAYGSDQIRFRYWFVTRNRTSESEYNCELPIGRHKERNSAVITHKFGKKASTQFRKQGESDHGALWEATTLRPRFHQVRLHAAELGIPVWGDELYDEQKDEEPPKYHRRRNPVNKLRFSGLASILVSMDLTLIFDEEMVLSASFSKPFSLMLRKSGLWQAE